MACQSRGSELSKPATSRKIEILLQMLKCEVSRKKQKMLWYPYNTFTGSRDLPKINGDGVFTYVYLFVRQHCRVGSGCQLYHPPGSSSPSKNSTTRQRMRKRETAVLYESQVRWICNILIRRHSTLTFLCFEKNIYIQYYYISMQWFVIKWVPGLEFLNLNW